MVGIYGPTRPARNGPLVAGRRHRVARRRLSVPSSAALPARTHVPARHRGRRSARRPSNGGFGGAGASASGRPDGLRADWLEGRCARDVIGVIARMRVALGFVCGALVLWLARPDRPVAAGRHVDRGVRRGAAHLGRRSSEQVARGDRVGSVPLGARTRCMSDRRVMGVGLAVACAQRRRRRADRGLPGDDADGGDQERGGVSAADVRRQLRSLSARRRREARDRGTARRRFSLAQAMREPRAPRGRSGSSSRCCCSS